MNVYGYDWPQGGTKQIAYVDGQSHVVDLSVGYGDPWQSTDLTELTGAPPPSGSALAGYAWSAGGTKQVVYSDQQSHIIELYVARESPWQWVDLTNSLELHHPAVQPLLATRGLREAQSKWSMWMVKGM